MPRKLQLSGHVYKTTLYREDGDEETPLKITAEWSIEDDSIGAYEFWGERCVDPHKYHPIIEDVKDEDGDSINLTDREQESIMDDLYREMAGILGDNE